MNNYGLDSKYFKEKLELIIRDVEQYTPDEMFRTLSKHMMFAARQAGIKVNMEVIFPIRIKQNAKLS